MTLHAEPGYTGGSFARWSAIAALGVVAPLAAVVRPHLGDLGSVILAAVLATGAMSVLVYIALQRSFPRSSTHIVLGALPLIVLYAISTAVHPSSSGMTHVIQLILVVGFTIGLSLVPWTRSRISMLLWAPTLLLVTHVVWWAASGAPRTFGGIFAHPNSLGLFALAYAHLAYLMMRSSQWRSLRRLMSVVGIASAGILMIASGSRATWVAVAASIAVAVAWPMLARRRGLFHLTFVAVIIVALLSTWAFMVAPSHPWGWQLQELSVRLTGQNLFSGRHLFWDDIGIAIATRPWFGHGAGATAESITGYSWSSHNLYLQTALQTGGVGLVLLVLFLWTIWAQFRSRYTDIGVRLAAAFFAGVLVHQVFEVSLTQNNIATGFLAWIIVSIGLSRRQWDAR